MAEETLVKEPLTREMILAGQELVKELDLRKADLKCAFWMYYPEIGQWRLVLSLHLVDTEGPNRAYALVQEALEKLPEAIRPRLEEVKLLSPDHSLIKSMRSTLRTEPQFITGIRFTRNRVNDVFVEDAYVYRVN
jgi:hypothetical protein